MNKYIIEQILPEAAELSFYFDGDSMTERAGGIQYALFPLVADRWKVLREYEERTGAKL